MKVLLDMMEDGEWEGSLGRLCAEGWIIGRISISSGFASGVL